MEQERGDDYLRRLASFIRANEKNLAEAGLPRRLRNMRPASSSVKLFPSLGWLGKDPSNNTSFFHKPMTLSIDTHHLFYVLMRLEASGYDIGNLDVYIEAPSRPMNYINLYPEQHSSETLSLASFRSSLSVASRISLGDWWNRSDPITLDSGMRYLYSSFTKLPALSICAPSKQVIAELLNDSPSQNAVPLDAFKNLQALQCEDIDPRTLLGWDRLADSLRSLRIRKSGLQDMSEIFLGAVLDDQARQGSVSRKRQRNIPEGPITRAFFPSTSLTNIEDEDSGVENIATNLPSFVPSSQFKSHKWAFLKHLYLSDNELTFFPTDLFPHLTSVTHLDLSSNLFVAVPPGLGTLHNLLSLSLADNLIDSVVGINLNLGQVLFLNLAHNRLESLCGLERLLAVEKVDLRNNLLDETAEVGRLATLPHISEIWVEGNPFVEIEAGYRVSCFDYFWKEGKTILLDGTVPGFYEKRYLTLRPAEQMSSSRLPSATSSPHVIAVDHNLSNTSETADISSGTSISPFTPVDKRHRKRSKRIVNLDTSLHGHARPHSHFQTRSEGGYDNHHAYAAPVLPQAAINEVNTSAIAHHNASPPGYRHHRSEHDSTYDTPDSLWNLDMHTSSEVSNCSAGVNQGYLIPDIPQANSITSILGSISGLPNGGVDTNSDTYRKKIEGLKKDTGESWLKIYSQGQENFL